MKKKNINRRSKSLTEKIANDHDKVLARWLYPELLPSGKDDFGYTIKEYKEEIQKITIEKSFRNDISEKEKNRYIDDAAFEFYKLGTKIDFDYRYLCIANNSAPGHFKDFAILFTALKRPDILKKNPNFYLLQMKTMEDKKVEQIFSGKDIEKKRTRVTKEEKEDVYTFLKTIRSLKEEHNLYIQDIAENGLNKFFLKAGSKIEDLEKKISNLNRRNRSLENNRTVLFKLNNSLSSLIYYIAYQNSKMISDTCKKIAKYKKQVCKHNGIKHQMVALDGNPGAIMSSDSIINSVQDYACTSFEGNVTKDTELKDAKRRVNKYFRLVEKQARIAFLEKKGVYNKEYLSLCDEVIEALEPNLETHRDRDGDTIPTPEMHGYPYYASVVYEECKARAIKEINKKKESKTSKWFKRITGGVATAALIFSLGWFGSKWHYDKKDLTKEIVPEKKIVQVEQVGEAYSGYDIAKIKVKEGQCVDLITKDYGPTRIFRRDKKMIVDENTKNNRFEKLNSDGAPNINYVRAGQLLNVLQGPKSKVLWEYGIEWEKVKTPKGFGYENFSDFMSDNKRDKLIWGKRIRKINEKYGLDKRGYPLQDQYLFVPIEIKEKLGGILQKD